MNESASAGADDPPGEEIASRLKSPHHNRRGQLLRGDGQRTRTRILVEILKLLATAPLSEVTMANVTKRLGLNAAAFYRYFSDIGEALIAAYECVLDDAEAILPIIEQDWSARGARVVALEIVDAFHRLWKRHAPLLLARNSLADARDPRFVACRRRLVEPLTLALAARLEATRPPGQEASAVAVAGALMMALERAVTLSANDIHGVDQSWPDLRLALAEMIQAAAAGPARP
jgi:AcrR family transcriptional regulator